MYEDYMLNKFLKSNSNYGVNIRFFLCTKREVYCDGEKIPSGRFFIKIDDIMKKILTDRKNFVYYQDLHIPNDVMKLIFKN